MSTPEPRIGAAVPAAGDEGLVRVMGRWTLVALMINSTIGAGIFGLPSVVHKLLGDAAPVGYIVAALGIGVIAACFAEVASQFPASGGTYLYAREAFGRFVGVQTGWLALLVRVTAHAAIASLIVTYLGEFVPGITGPIPRAVTLVLVLAALAFVNVRGMRHAARLSNVFTFAKLVPLLLFAGVALALVGDRLSWPSALPPADAFGQGVLALIFAFGGFENALLSMGEARQPRRDIPLALGLGLGSVAAVYMAAHLAVVAALPDPTSSTRPVADAARALGGAGAAAFVSVGAVLSIVGILTSGMMNTPRLTFALARGGDLPAALGRVHPVYRTPYLSVIAYAVAVALIAIVGGFVWNAVLSAVGRLLTYGVVCAALLRLRRKHPDADAWRLPAAPVFCVLGLAFCLVFVSQMGRSELIAIGVTMLLALGHWYRVRAR